MSLAVVVKRDQEKWAKEFLYVCGTGIVLFV